MGYFLDDEIGTKKGRFIWGSDIHMQHRSPGHSYSPDGHNVDTHTDHAVNTLFYSGAVSSTPLINKDLELQCHSPPDQKSNLDQRYLFHIF